ncbi:3-phosphoshikimate 1-carboxyvinyltransferase [candidate division KSB1 bacterium]|nr:3-phosphoshikimate 1-carboxyvinyltransferase [candidate division KSB1 bacterium]
MNISLSPCFNLSGIISMNGDKSISHRALMFGAIAQSVTHITNLSTSEDVSSTERCLKQLGIKIVRQEGVTMVHGVGLRGFQRPLRPLDAGNSGTTMRLLTGLLVGQDFDAILTGDESLRKRPMKRILEPLSRMGASIKATTGNFAPLNIHGSPIFSTTYTMPIASAQVKSCLLMAALYARGVTTIHENAATRNHTELMLADFNVKIDVEAHRISIKGDQQLLANDIAVPGDVSSASFFLAAALLTPNSTVTIRNVGLNPTRLGFIRVLQKMGAQIVINPVISNQQEPFGDITVRTSPLRSITLTAETIPSLIDELPIFAIIASQAKGVTTVTGAKELRFKESDRLRAISHNLKQMGVEINELDDGFIIYGIQQLKGAHIDSYHDHRIAMAFSVAALIASGVTTIHDAECISISMPEFFQVMDSIIQNSNYYTTIV